MKKTIMMLALGMTSLGLATAEEASCKNDASCAKAQVAKAEAPKAVEAAKLSADEQAFAAKLSDANRKAFSDKFSADQRKAAMIAVKNGANADEAVQKMLAAKELKDAPAVANAEKPAANAAK